MASSGKKKKKKTQEEWDKFWEEFIENGAEYTWAFDKLGRPLNVGQVIVWFSDGKDKAPVAHLAYIMRYNKASKKLYARPIKSKEYIQSWENERAKVGANDNLYETDGLLEVDRLKANYGVFILDEITEDTNIFFPHLVS